MGVSGLLPLLKSIHKHVDLKKFAGETIGVDAYGWLHRGAIACAVELAQGKPTRKYVDFALHRVRMLRHFGVTPYLVFDGDFLPSKALTEGSRAQRREEKLKLGMELLKAGRPSVAHAELQKAIDITPEMARNLIDELKKLGVEYVVAPYEADAQLVYLERQGIITGILSEDSDLLVFGCKRLLTKLDQYGNCVEINRRDFGSCREVSLTGWTDADFRRMAILSGCDYLAGINNMGLKTAYRMVRKYKTPERLVRMIQFEGKHRLSEDYMSQFTKAELTFLHQRVFCPKKQEMVCLTEPPSGQQVEDMPFIGAYVEPSVARAVASGDVNPMTKLLIVPAPMPETKRRHSQSASRANASITPSNPAPYVATGGLRRPPGRPIDTFFKKRGRIPMGEMDTNCFTVDPQRLAALTNNGLVPRVFPLPRPYLEPAILPALPVPPVPRRAQTSAPAAPPREPRRRSEPTSSLLAQQAGDSTSPRPSQAAGSSRISLGSIDSSLMANRPPKKVRLCDEGTVNEPNGNENQRSRYFSAAQSEPSEVEKNNEFLFSDDSIEEALLGLPDVDGWHNTKTSRKTIEIHEESSDKVPNPTDNADGATLAHEGTHAPADDHASSSPVSELQGSIRADEEPAMSDCTPLNSTLRRFTYSQGNHAMAQDTPSSALSGGASSIFTPSTAAPSTVASSIGLSSTRPSNQAGLSTKRQVLTPLQRIGAQALQRKHGSTPQLRTYSPKANAKKGGQRTLASMPVNPSFVPLPKVDLDEVESLNRPLGSEDYLVPDSDGENDPDEARLADQDELAKAPLRVPNLSRFIFR